MYTIIHMNKKSLEFTMRIGPIRFPNGGLPGIDREHQLSKDVFICEQSDPSKNTAFYNLILKKELTDHEDVDKASLQLNEYLRWFGFAWYWAGGGLTRFEELKIRRETLFESNAEIIRNELLEEKGIIELNSQGMMNVEFTQTLIDYPLERAVEIFAKCEVDKHLGDLLRYYYEASFNELTWYAELYKIVDVLKKKFVNLKHAQQILDIRYEDWKFFEKTLDNHNLRHASNIGAKSDLLDSESKTKLFALAEKWIKNYLSRSSFD